MNRILMVIALIIVLTGIIVYFPKLSKSLKLPYGVNKLSSPLPLISPQRRLDFSSPQPSSLNSMNTLPKSGLLPETGL